LLTSGSTGANTLNTYEPFGLSADRQAQPQQTKHATVSICPTGAASGNPTGRLPANLTRDFDRAWRFMQDDSQPPMFLMVFHSPSAKSNRTVFQLRT
jgi:hypothetical protein